MRGLLAAICAAVAVTLAWPGAALAETADYVGQVVRALSVVADGRPVSDPRLLALIETPLGVPLRMEQVRTSIAHLFSLGRFQDVRVRADARPDGVALSYELVPVQTVAGITFTGVTAPGVDAGHLRRAVADRFGAAPQPRRIADVSAFLEEQLRQAGYLRSHVSGRLEATGVNQERLAFDLMPGDRTIIRSVDVEGDTGLPPARFLAALDLSNGAAFEREALNTRIDHYIDERRSKGYYATRVSLVPRFADEDRSVDLLVNVTLGPHTRLVFAGDQLPEDRRAELVPVAREGSTDEDLLEDSTNRIESYLRNQGYRDAAAPHAVQVVDQELVITFDVKRGPQYRVGDITITGSESIALGTLQQRMRVRTGQPFSDAALTADLEALEDLYRREGFALASAQETSVPGPVLLESPDVAVAVTIEIVEGVRTLVSGVSFEGNKLLTDDDLRLDVGLQAGKPFFATQMAFDRDAVELHYANSGFPAAVVTATPRISADGTEAAVTYSVHEGDRVYVDHVLIVGTKRTKDITILNELQFKSGDPFGLAAINESQRRLIALGIFSRARITSLEHGDVTRRDVLVTVEEAPLTTQAWTVGLEVRPKLTDSAAAVAEQTLEFAPRASYEIGRRNLFGRNRSVNLFMSLSVVPEKTTASSTNTNDVVPGFFEYRVLPQFREPKIFDSAADFRVTADFEQQSRTSFDFKRKSVSAEIGGRLTREVSVSGGYQIQQSLVFNEQVDPEEQRTIDRILPNIRLSFFSGSIIRDTRDDPINPGAGRYLSANTQIAARAIGSEVGFLKSYFTAQTFRTLPSAPRVVLAGSGRLGLARATDIGNGGGDLPASERFFAGGDTTVRGFALDQLGVRHSPPEPSDTVDSQGFPLGGNGLVILNGEARVAITGSIGVAGFVDVGNVFKAPSDISIPELRTAVGFGARYRSPLGTIRVDLGFKVNPRDYGVLGQESPTALHISFGQAF